MIARFTMGRRRSLLHVLGLNLAGARRGDSPELRRLGASLEANHRRRIELAAVESAEEEEELYEQHWRLREQINAVPARTQADLRVKARAAQCAQHFDRQVDNEGPGSFRGLAESLVADVLAR